MPEDKRNQLKNELNKALKNVASCDLEDISLQGDIIRGVFFTMMEANFTPEEINEVFDGVSISDEKMSLIEKADKGFNK